MRGTLLIVVAAVLVTVVASSPRHRYGHGGHGLAASATALSYQGVMACVFELADVNHDRTLSQVELRLALRRWVGSVEQALDGLTEHRILAQCDTDSSRSVSWAEVIEEPRCLSLPQVEGLAKWMCARARHGDFVFDEYKAVATVIEEGLVSGKGFKSISYEFQALMKSQTDARRAAIARQLHQPRLSDEVDAILVDLGAAVSTIVVLPISVALVVLSLAIACIA